MWEKLKVLRKLSDVPVAAGFGISGTAQVKEIKKSVDGVIIGSFFVKKILDGKIKELWKGIKEIKSLGMGKLTKIVLHIFVLLS